MLRYPAVVTLVLLFCTGAWAQRELENIALGKTYELSPAPDYPQCTDDGDMTDLTDGQFTTGMLWVHTGAVGWRWKREFSITVDLGGVYSIAGAAFSTAAAQNNVEWPGDLHLFVSDDNQTWYAGGDLSNLSANEADDPPPTGRHTYRTTRMKTYGRYIRFLSRIDGSYGFVDEVEVYPGDDDWAGTVDRGEPVEDFTAHIARGSFDGLIHAQLRRDLRAVREAIAAPETPQAQRNALSAKADVLLASIGTMPPVDPEGFRAILPMVDLERDIFRLQAEVWRAQGKPELRIWKNHRWDPLSPWSEPAPDAPEPVLGVKMMSNEHRADVINFTNAGERDTTVRVRIEGLPGGTNSDYVTVYEVLCVGTRRYTEVSAALPPAGRAADGYALTVPSGMTRQLWFDFHPLDVEPGVHTGELAIEVDGRQPQRVAMQMQVYPFTFPEGTTLLLSGWEYTDADTMRGVTPQNRDAFIAYLQDHLVNAPWASGSALPMGTFDEQGNYTQKPDTARFDAWVARWPGAKRYMVFVGFGNYNETKTVFAGAEAGTPQFDAKVGAWARFWADHARELGLEPGQLGLLLIDEPHNEVQYNATTAYARAIKKAAPEIIIWVDPQPHDADTPREMFSVADVLVPNRRQWLLEKPWFFEMFAQEHQMGRELGFYLCDGPARRFDPFSYYLLQQWHCFEIGGTWAGFWSFGDTGGADVWNEYTTAGGGPFAPLYLARDSVTGAKYFEAIREGVQDYEYLVMLRSRADEVAAEHPDSPAVAHARELLDTAYERVSAGEVRDLYWWHEDKDRSLADQVRIEVLEAMVGLGEL
jgi:hypothetical protein